MRICANEREADAVVVGGGTVGAWCAYFLRQAGLPPGRPDREGRTLGAGREQPGGRAWSGRRAGHPRRCASASGPRRFYLSQRDEIGTDSGFTDQGYLLPCFTEAEVAAAHARMAMQAALGVPVRWLDPGEVDTANPTLAPGRRSAAPSAPRTGTSRRRATWRPTRWR